VAQAVVAVLKPALKMVRLEQQTKGSQVAMALLQTLVAVAVQLKWATQTVSDMEAMESHLR
jgi:hypothetical protein